MSDKTYTNKENAKDALQNALLDYYRAAEADGLDVSNMAYEIETACKEAGISVAVLED